MTDAIAPRNIFGRQHESLLALEEPPPQAFLPFLQEHEIIRPLSEYEELVRTAFTKEREA